MTSCCKNLVLDAGPLLSLSPLRGLAETYVTTPEVLAELRDNRAREHFEKLGLMAGVKVSIQSPDPASFAKVIEWAKKTGDYAVLSHADLCVLALTYSLHEKERTTDSSEDEKKPLEGATDSNVIVDLTDSTEPSDLTDGINNISLDSSTETSGANPEGLMDAPDERLPEDSPSDTKATVDAPIKQPSNGSPLYYDPSDSDDGEGEWITPSNVGLHKSKALNFLPSGAQNKKRAASQLGTGCMTADFAMQNVLLQMGLNLVGVEGQRIERVKSWVLRCHACFKICKDSSKKFCPSCGNPTLLRASVTISTPNASADAPVMQVHLKTNFQYKIRGTKYSIPAPKPGTSKTGTGEGLILREDQAEYMRAKKRADGKREREEAKMLKGIINRSHGGDIGSAGVGSWMDPDWIPEIMSVGSGGKGRSGRDADMPAVGYGRRNPNERRKKK